MHSKAKKKRRGWLIALLTLLILFLILAAGAALFVNSKLSLIAYSDGRYTFKIGGSSNVEYKFGMLVSVMSQLKEGDVGTIDVSDGTTAHFIPN